MEMAPNLGMSISESRLQPAGVAGGGGGGGGGSSFRKSPITLCSPPVKLRIKWPNKHPSPPLAAVAAAHSSPSRISTARGMNA